MILIQNTSAEQWINGRLQQINMGFKEKKELISSIIKNKEILNE